MTGATVSTTVASELVGMPHRTLHRYARGWYPQLGYGHRIGLTQTDVMVCRAIVAINGGRGSTNPNAARLRTLAETAIRAHPRRWLVLSTTTAATYATTRHVAAALTGAGRCNHRVIDLQPDQEMAA
jgi:hypothetical protein